MPSESFIRNVAVWDESGKKSRTQIVRIESEDRHMPVVANAVYTMRIDAASDAITYIGEADVGSDEARFVWRIKRIETTGNGTKVLYANGNDRFEHVWTNRLQLNYL